MYNSHLKDIVVNKFLTDYKLLSKLMCLEKKYVQHYYAGLRNETKAFDTQQ